MAAPRHTFQYLTTISIPRDDFMRNIILNRSLDKQDLRVILHLMTYLDGKNYKTINAKHIAKDLGLKKKEVEASIEYLLDEEIIAVGNSASVKNGLRLCF
jgi:coproporphyrinogen III oxidase-like Fe-S oxidoreductase